MHIQLPPLPTSSMAMVDLPELRNHGAALFSNLGALSPFLQCFHSRAFSVAVSGPGSHTAFWLSRLPSLWPATVSHSFSACHDLDSLGNTAQVVYGMALCGFFSWLDWSYGFRERTAQRWGAVIPSCQGYVCLQDLALMLSTLVSWPG